jgi:hypothetical protein
MAIRWPEQGKSKKVKGKSGRAAARRRKEVYEPLGLSQRVAAASGDSGRCAEGKSGKVKGKSGRRAAAFIQFIPSQVCMDTRVLEVEC